MQLRYVDWRLPRLAGMVGKAHGAFAVVWRRGLAVFFMVSVSAGEGAGLL